MKSSNKLPSYTKLKDLEFEKWYPFSENNYGFSTGILLRRMRNERIQILHYYEIEEGTLGNFEIKLQEYEENGGILILETLYKESIGFLNKSLCNWTELSIEQIYDTFVEIENTYDGDLVVIDIGVLLKKREFCNEDDILKNGELETLLKEFGA